MITSLGKKLREIRLAESDRLLDMAKKLSVSSAFLSAIEHGRKQPPKDFVAALTNEYELSPATKGVLTKECDKARSGVIVRAKRPLARETAAIFARSLNSLSDDKLKEIQSLLDSTSGANNE